MHAAKAIRTRTIVFLDLETRSQGPATSPESEVDMASRATGSLLLTAPRSAWRRGLQNYFRLGVRGVRSIRVTGLRFGGSGFQSFWGVKIDACDSHLTVRLELEGSRITAPCRQSRQDQNRRSNVNM